MIENIEKYLSKKWRPATPPKDNPLFNKRVEIVNDRSISGRSLEPNKKFIGKIGIVFDRGDANIQNYFVLYLGKNNGLRNSYSRHGSKFQNGSCIWMEAEDFRVLNQIFKEVDEDTRAITVQMESM